MFLTSNNFDSRAPNTFRQLWNYNNFTDVTLATVDNQQIRAHKVILSSGSQFFQEHIIKESTSESSPVPEGHQTQGTGDGHEIHLPGSV